MKCQYRNYICCTPSCCILWHFTGLFDQNMEDLTEQYTNIIGDVLISAAVVAYLGPFILDFRQVYLVCGLPAHRISQTILFVLDAYNFSYAERCFFKQYQLIMTLSGVLSEVVCNYVFVKTIYETGLLNFKRAPGPFLSNTRTCPVCMHANVWNARIA